MKEKRNKGPKVVIGGYYGYGSIGDEAMLSAIISQIEKTAPDTRVFVINRDRYLEKRTGPLIPVAIARRDVFSLLYDLLTADIFVFGGGSLLQDSTSSKSLFYYKTLLRLAALLGCRIYIYANGIGPLSQKKKLRGILEKAERISLREKASFDECRRILKSEGEGLFLSADPVFLDYPPKVKERPLSCLRSLGGKRYFAVSLRECRGERQVDLLCVAAAVNRIRAEGAIPVFVPMQREYDLEICRRAAHLTEGAVADCRNMEDVLHLVSGAEFCIGMRLHFLLAAVMAGVACVALSYDCKVRSTMEYLGVFGTLDAFSFSENDLYYAVFAARHCTDREKLSERSRQMSDLAREDISLLLEMIAEKNEEKKEERAEQVSG